MTERVREILSWYRSDNPGTLTNLARILYHGRLGGTGKLVILPVDQGFEHGPGRALPRTRPPMTRAIISSLPSKQVVMRMPRRWGFWKREPPTMRDKFHSF